MPTYFCFIESDILRTPHMEPLLATTDDEALAQAADLLRSHASGVAAHIVLNEARVGTVRAERPVPA